MAFFLVGGIFALLVRLSLLDPSHMMFGHKMLDAETYNQVFTLHGAIMVFLFIIPSIPAALGNFVLAADAGREGRGVPAAESLPATTSTWSGALLGVDRRSLRAASTPAGRSTRRTARPRQTALSA